MKGRERIKREIPEGREAEKKRESKSNNGSLREVGKKEIIRNT